MEKIEFYKIRNDDSNHLIIKAEKYGSLFYISRGGDFEYLDGIVTITKLDSKEPFEFETNNYLGNGLIKIDIGTILDLNEGCIKKSSDFKKSITLKSGDHTYCYLFL